MISSRRSKGTTLRALVQLSALALVGCASQGVRLAGTPALSDAKTRVELTGTPFYPQQDLQCGPAAVATVLGAAGLSVEADALVPEVYTPGLSGSLQPELLSAIRRRGLLAYELSPTLDALGAELVAGRPVLVLQNLGLDVLPAWHYAVVIGADPSAEQLLLRSGEERRLPTPTGKFMRTWDKADRWAVVVLQPGDLPVDPQPDRYHRAVMGLETSGRHAEAARAWQAALGVWPDDRVALFGLGNAVYALGDFAGARAAWERYVILKPDDPPGRNNLAVVLGQLGCQRRALRLARRTLAGLSPDDVLYPDVLDTVETLQAMSLGDDAAYCRPPGDGGEPAYSMKRPSQRR